MKNKYLLLSYFFLLQSACVPTVYFVESSTVLENEAAGEWPKMEQEMRRQLQKDGATFFEKEDDSTRRRRALNLINGELVDNE